jgi:transposase
MPRHSRYSPELRERAVRMVQEHAREQPLPMGSDQCDRPEDWVFGRNPSEMGAEAERDAGQRPGLTTDEQQRLKALERENRELRRANEILRKASAFVAQAELDRRGT